jgi:hypothetical protein
MASAGKALSLSESITHDQPSGPPSPTTPDGGLLDSINRDNDHAIVVDWNGPDDPDNPRKWVVHSSLIIVSL